jgi:tetratricopeptide (TPR) repeat protein
MAQEELELLLEELAPQPPQPDARIRLHQALADLQRARGDESAASATLKSVEHLSGGSQPTRQEQDEQVQLLTRELNHAEAEDEQAAILLQLGELYERMGEIEMAIETFSDALEIEAGPEVLAALKRVNQIRC